MNHNSQQPSHMPLGGLALSCPLIPVVDQNFRTHIKPYKLSTNTKPHKQQRSIHSPNISTKATNNQNNLHKQENKTNTPKSQYTFVKAIP
jgi:hypothetical protein